MEPGNKRKVYFDYNIYDAKISEIASSQLELNSFFAEASKILSYTIPNKENKENKEQKETEEMHVSPNTDSNSCIKNDDVSYPENTLLHALSSAL